jgi:hypothetical protein
LTLAGDSPEAVKIAEASYITTQSSLDISLWYIHRAHVVKILRENFQQDEDEKVTNAFEKASTSR